MKLRMLSRGINVSTVFQEFRPANNSCNMSNPRYQWPVSLARLEDDSGLARMFLCCYVDTHIRVYDCEELMAVTVPPRFTRVKEILGINGDLKRVFAPQGTIFSYDVNGRTRVEEQCRNLTVPISMHLVVCSFTSLSPRSGTILKCK
jgi:hypothetical protein